MKIAAITIRRKPVPGSPIRTNTGNYMFTEATYRNIAGDISWIGFNFDPDKINAEYDHVVMPAANWIDRGETLGSLVNLLKRIEIPITCIGLGAQAASAGADPSSLKLSQGAIDLTKILTERCKHISVRGEFTRKVLAHLGCHNTVVTGCPSLYMDLPKDIDPPPSEDLILQGTRYVMSPQYLRTRSLDRKIFSIAGRAEMDMIYQSERLEISLFDGAMGEGWASAAEEAGLHKLYGKATVTELQDYLRAHGKVFTSIDDWSGFLKSRAGVIGTRLHGAILALNSGVRATLLPHDSRTHELIDFAKIPTGNPDLLLNEDQGTVRLPEDIDAQVGAFVERREENRVVYAQLLEANGLTYRRSLPDR
ncbi:polysaccharide pyruvyl transferase family protein [Rhodobacter capsulatus]|uniref:polysaccharide pyruvyl transferase family protein n=1 Tax=Rhodobacter capsulatus TaxID=1061 RepID=UPI0009C12581|nr:polysaccharide pyruvyl transferase family protein [Rhodobacter capsulatus]QNR64219.1 polysaccharide pyruvyl transferase family protein [Rhodobacter capsulatus]